MEDQQIKKMTEELVDIYARQFSDYIAIGDNGDSAENFKCQVFYPDMPQDEELRLKALKATDMSFPELDLDKTMIKFRQHPELLMDPPKGTYLPKGRMFIPTELTPKKDTDE